MENHSSVITFWRISLILRIFAGHQVVAELDGVLRIGDFGGVQAAVDVDDRLVSCASLRACSSVTPRESARRRETSL